MNPLLLKLIGAGVIVAAAAGCYFYVRALHAENADLTHQLTDARQAVEARDQTIRGLQVDAAQKEFQQKQLDASTSKVRTATAAVRQQIQQVIHENPTVRAWADDALPDDVVRLSASPAYTGATDFGAAVPDDHAVHAASGVAAD